MILALAMRHSVERPAMSMEGGKAYGAALPAAVCEAFEKRIDTMINPRRILCADFDEKSAKKAFHGEIYFIAFSKGRKRKL